MVPKNNSLMFSLFIRRSRPVSQNYVIGGWNVTRGNKLRFVHELASWQTEQSISVQ